MESDTRPIGWIPVARREYEKFPTAVQDWVGTALTIAAEGGKADIAKPMKMLCALDKKLQVTLHFGWRANRAASATHPA